MTARAARGKLALGVEFAQHPLPLPLRPYVRSLWELRGPGGPEPELIVPDGCMELVLNLGEPIEELQGSAPVRQPRVLFVGELRRPVCTRPLGRLHLLGVRLSPGTAGLFADAEADALADGMHDEAALAPPLRRALRRILAAEPEERPGLLLAGLGAALADRPREDTLALRAARALEESHGRLAIAALEPRLGVGRRHLERRFKAAVGVSPKSFAQVLRFRRLLAAVEAQEPDWAGLAVDLGYADQSHLIRDFKRYTGRTPGAYLSRSHPLTALLHEGRISPIAGRQARA